MRFINHVEKFVPDLKAREILDLGCGRGYDLIEFVKYGYNAAGIDTNQEYLDFAKNIAQKQGLAPKLYWGEAEHLPFRENSFDFIFASEVTEHVEDPEKVLSECARVLRHGGKMYVSFHNRYGIYDHHYHLYFINWMPRLLAEKIISFLGKSKNDNQKAGVQKLSDMHYFTYDSAVNLLKKYNFDYIDSREEQIKNPGLSDRKVLTIIAKLKLSNSLIFLLKKFYGTFHFIAIKP